MSPITDSLKLHVISKGAFLPGTSRKSKGIDSCRMRIMPPQESFTLCHYTANLLRELPIDGFYQMKASNESVDKFKNDNENKTAF